MDGSPLISAQTHAQKASKADNPIAAIDEHDQAASHFAQAAKDTNNSEALRTLKLLEQHHEKLAQIIRFRTTHPIIQDTSQTKSSVQGSPTSASRAPTPTQEKSLYRPETQSLPAAHRPRDVSSSIASNLASARGIPSVKQRRSGQASSPTVNQQNAEGKIFNPPRRSRLVDPPSKSRETNTSEKDAPPSRKDEVSKDEAIPPKEAPLTPSPAKSDESFKRFYSTFESLFAKLSAPLAFAGLPLNPDADNHAAPTTTSTAIITSTPQIPQTPLSQRPKPKTRATASPEYSRLFSPAALRAIREEPGNNALGAAESFYVVPTTGGTMPYASILARHGGSQPALSRDSTGFSEEPEEFVDARETPGPPSPLASRGKRGPVTASGKTLEELELENSGLRGICDELSRRLWQFEMTSQMSQQALHQSIRAGLKAREGEEGLSGSGEGPAKDADMRLKGFERDMAALKRENEKLKGVVGKYREKWEKLKEGARMRRDGSGVGGREDAE